MARDVFVVYADGRREPLPAVFEVLYFAVGQLLENCSSVVERLTVAAFIFGQMGYLREMAPVAQRFANFVLFFALGRTSPVHVRCAYYDFLAEVGPIIGRHNKAALSGAKGGKARAERVREKTAAKIKAAVERLKEMKPEIKDSPYVNEQQLAEDLHELVLPGQSVRTVRRWLDRWPDLPRYVEGLPPKRRT